MKIKLINEKSINENQCRPNSYQIHYTFVLSFFLLKVFNLPQSRTYTPQELTTQMPVGQMSVGEQLSMDQNTRLIHKGGPPWMCGQHIRASAGDNTGQNTKETHPIPG